MNAATPEPVGGAAPAAAPAPLPAAVAAAAPGAVPGSTPRGRPSVAAVLWLTAVWVLLWGHLTWANLLGGLVVGYLVAAVLPLPRVPFAGRPSPLGSVRLLAKLSVDILVASIHVAGLALRLNRTPRSGVIHVLLRSRSDLYLTLTADLCALVPGSVIVEAHRATSTLYIHVLDLDGPDAIEDARRNALAQEARVMYALASDSEIADAGLPPRHLGGASRAALDAVPVPEPAEGAAPGVERSTLESAAEEGER